MRLEKPALRPSYKGSSETSGRQQSCYTVSVHHRQKNPIARKLSSSQDQGWTGNVSQGPWGTNNAFAMLFQGIPRVSQAVSHKDPPCRLVSDMTFRLCHVKPVLGQRGETHGLGPSIQELIQVGGKAADGTPCKQASCEHVCRPGRREPR